MIWRYADISTISASSNREIVLIGNESLTKTGSTAASKIVKLVSQLFVDRWIGLEGVMAVVSFPQKGGGLFVQALTERRERGKLDIFTKKIALSGLGDKDAEVFQYASIPGGAAFFYYTGSLWWVFGGMVALTLLMLLSERLIVFLTGNPYLSAFWGAGVAQTVASFGLATGQTAVYYAVCLSSVFFISIIQKISPAAKRD